MIEIVQGFTEDLIRSVKIEFDPNGPATHPKGGHAVRAKVAATNETVYEKIQGGIFDGTAAAKYVKKPYFLVWRGFEDSTNLLATQQVSIWLGTQAIVNIDNVAEDDSGLAGTLTPLAPGAAIALGIDGKFHALKGGLTPDMTVDPAYIFGYVLALRANNPNQTALTQIRMA